MLQLIPPVIDRQYKEKGPKMTKAEKILFICASIFLMAAAYIMIDAMPALKGEPLRIVQFFAMLCAFNALLILSAAVKFGKESD